MTRASDHVDGPIAIGEPVSDITDLFAFPTAGRPGHLTVILNVYPLVSRRGHFSDRVRYELLLRRAAIRGVGRSAGFDTVGDYRISCSFETPHGWFATHRVTCQSTAGTVVSADVDAIDEVAPSSGLRVFAGRRSDPFFLNTPWFSSVSERGVLLPPRDDNGLEDMNVLSVALEVDVAAELGAGAGSLLAVAAQTVTTDEGSGETRRLDRVGRPEITNVCLVARDRVELKPRYNAEEPFAVAAENLPDYRARLRENVDWYDGIDGAQEWPEADRNALVELLLADFLVVDTAPGCTGVGFFAIEAALLRGERSESCGGRALDDDIMDTLLTLLVHRGRKPGLRDGVDRATRPPETSFPHLAAPSDGPVQFIRGFITRATTGVSSSGGVWWGGALGLVMLGLVALGLVALLVYGARVLAARRRGSELSTRTRARSLGLVAVCLAAASVCLGVSSVLLGIAGTLPVWLPSALVLGAAASLVRGAYWRRR
ncbi:MAG: DUF4331 family protein [Nannocystaceae bacterium]|nr:DUF4331 family protein [Myxococcales bacterium]